MFEMKGPDSAVRVRRVNQFLSVACPGDWSKLRLLDLGCGEGMFSIEAALQGASVLAVDGREERMARGRALAEQLNLDRLRFVQADVLTHPFQGPFDAVLMLGLLYHFNAPELFELVERGAAATRRALIVDTYVTLTPTTTRTWRDEVYSGWLYREHRSQDPVPVRRGRLKASLDNEESFWMTPQSWFELLTRVGFDTVLECRAPLWAGQDQDRLMLLALKNQAPEPRTVPDHPPPPSLRFTPPAGLYQAALTEATVTLGAWARAHPEFVIGPLRDGVGLWRRAPLEGYVGKLRDIPPLLAVVVVPPSGGLPSFPGVETVWLVRPEKREVTVGERAFTEGDRLPPAVPGLEPPVSELLPPG